MVSELCYFVGYYGARLPISLFNQVRILQILLTPLSVIFPIVPALIAPGKKQLVSGIVTVPVVLYCLFCLIINVAVPFLPYQIFMDGKPTLAESLYSVIQYASVVLFLWLGHSWSWIYSCLFKQKDTSAILKVLLLCRFLLGILEATVFIMVMNLCFHFPGWVLPLASIAFIFSRVLKGPIICFLLIVFVQHGFNDLMLLNLMCLLYLRLIYSVSVLFTDASLKGFSGAGGIGVVSTI